MIRKHKNADLALLARYVAGECNRRERDEVEALVAVDAEQSRALREIQLLYRESSAEQPSVDTDAAWQILDQRLNSGQGASGTRVIPMRTHGSRGARPRDSRTPRHRGWYGDDRQHKAKRRRHLISMAAVMFVIAVGAIVAGKYGVSADADKQQGVYATEKGQQMLVRLADGSQIRLNVDSRMIISPAFGEEHRDVHLDGEGYFEIARDEDLPFRITAGDAHVEVLGTSFNIRSYDAELTTEVVVAEGKVAVQRTNGALRDTVVLAIGEMASLSGGGHLAVRRHVDVWKYLAWTEGRLVFVDAPLETVAAQLEAWYDLEVDVDVDPRGIGATFNGSFEDETLSEILKTVATTLGLEFSRNHRHVVFYASRRHDRSGME